MKLLWNKIFNKIIKGMAQLQKKIYNKRLIKSQLKITHKSLEMFQGSNNQKRNKNNCKFQATKINH